MAAKKNPEKKKSPLQEKYEKYKFKVDTEELKRGSAKVEVDFPQPTRKFKIISETMSQTGSQNLEEAYFWVLNHMTEDWGLHKTIKVIDTFSSSEHGAFWGAANQRLQIVQGQVSNYLATIGKLMQALFQIIRDIRIAEERLQLYKDSYKPLNKNKVDESKKNWASEVVLKGYWVDLKDGGAKSPGSVYGMSTMLGFSILPDLFFNAPPMHHEQVDNYVEKLEFNRKVREVLKRKLKSYLIWKEGTYKETETWYNFHLKYLRQHYDAIQLYINWIKPYLRRIKQLTMSEKGMDSPDIVSTFETSTMELEVLAYRPASGGYNAVVMAHWDYRTRPMLIQGAEGHRSPAHWGKYVLTLRSYTWTDDDLKNYLKLREEENLELFSEIDKDLRSAIDNLGDDLRRFLDESKKDDKKEEVKKEEPKKEPIELFEPFKQVFSGFKEVAMMVYTPKSGGKNADLEEFEKKKNKKSAEGESDTVIWQTYKNFKKSHGMTAW